MAFVKGGTQFDRKTGKWTELFECEVESDLSELPACNPMSRCYVRETKKFYAVNKFGQWGPAAEADLPAVSTVQLDAVVHDIDGVDMGEFEFYMLKYLIDGGADVVIRAEISAGDFCAACGEVLWMHLSQADSTEMRWTQIYVNNESSPYLYQLRISSDSTAFEEILLDNGVIA